MINQYENAAAHTLEALSNLRNWDNLEWYAIPLLGVIFYIYSKEIQKAQESQNWDPLWCAITVIGVVFLNETWNSWVCWFTGVSAMWTTPGDSIFVIMFGINFEILCLFLLNGFTFYYLCSSNEPQRILGIPNRWFYGLLMAGISVAIEHALNSAGLLIWYFHIWDRDFVGFWIILWLGYFLFYLACILVLKLPTTKKRRIAIGIIYGIPTLMNIIAAIVGMRY